MEAQEENVPFLKSSIDILVYNMAMKRHEWWRKEYRERRYMEHLTEDELHQRTKDVFLNLMVITEENKVGLHPVNAEGRYWMSVWTHVLEEFVLRFGPYPAGFDKGFIQNLRVPSPEDPLAARAAAVVKALNKSDLRPGSYLVKYGKAEYLQQTFTKGIIRIAPAASYDDPSLNSAIRDRELEIYVQPPPSEMKLYAYDGKTGKPKGVFNPIGNIIRKTSESNFYVYCVSRILTPRLFLDFDADACLILKRPAAFIENIRTEVESKLPGWAGLGMPVKYFDPLHSKINAIDIFSQKHFHFSYQKEFRVVWLPPRIEKELQPVMIELGPLEDQCELIELNRI